MIVYNINKNIVNSVWLKLRISTKPKIPFSIKATFERGKVDSREGNF